MAILTTEAPTFDTLVDDVGVPLDDGTNGSGSGGIAKVDSGRRHLFVVYPPGTK